MKVVQNVGYAPNPGTRRRNQVNYLSPSSSNKRRGKNVPSSPLGRGKEALDVDRLHDAPLLTDVAGACACAPEAHWTPSPEVNLTASVEMTPTPSPEVDFTSYLERIATQRLEQLSARHLASPQELVRSTLDLLLKASQNQLGSSVGAPVSVALPSLVQTPNTGKASTVTTTGQGPRSENWATFGTKLGNPLVPSSADASQTGRALRGQGQQQPGVLGRKITRSYSEPWIGN